jgi:hypothetical protein
MSDDAAVDQDRVIDAEVLPGDDEMSEQMALAQIEQRPIQIDDDLRFLGKAMAGSGFFKDSLRESQAIVKILAGREMGLGPVQSMAGIHVFDGKIVIGAGLMASTIKRSKKYNYRVLSLTNEECKIQFMEDGDVVGISSFSMDEARQAQLTRKPVWQQYPRNLLFARAMSNGAKWYCADVFGGPVYDPEEMGHDEPPSWESGDG